MEIIDSGVWRRLGMPLVFICLAIVNLTNMHAVERRRAEADVPANGSSDSHPS